MGIAIKLAQYLLDREVAYELVPHTQSAPANAATSKVPADQVVKAVVIKNSAGFMLALLPASRHIRFDQLRQLLDSNVDIANEEQIETLFLDCEPGSVPALGAAYGLPIVVDDSLAGEHDFYVEGGDHTHLVQLSATSFHKLTQDARHGLFTDTRQAA